MDLAPGVNAEKPGTTGVRAATKPDMAIKDGIDSDIPTFLTMFTEYGSTSKFCVHGKKAWL